MQASSLRVVLIPSANVNGRDQRWLFTGSWFLFLMAAQLQTENAELWIEHVAEHFDTLKLAPAYYR